MQERTQIKRTRLRPWLMLTALALFWVGGPAGWTLRWALIRVAPRETRQFRLVSIGDDAGPDPATGAVLRVSAPRLKAFAREAGGLWAYAIPRGTLPETFTVSGDVLVRLSEETDETWLPVVLRVRPDVKYPFLKVSLPADLVNDALRYEDSFTRGEKTRRYALGRYSTIHQLRFDTVSLRSYMDKRQRDRPVTFRRITGHATGQVRFKVEENWFDLRTTAQVRRMELRCDVDFRKYVDGLAFTYKITIPRLDANVSNLAPMFERRPVEMLRETLEESFGRPRKLERLSRRRLPLYVPLDLELEFEVFQPR